MTTSARTLAYTASRSGSLVGPDFAGSPTRLAIWSRMAAARRYIRARHHHPHRQQSIKGKMRRRSDSRSPSHCICFSNPTALDLRILSSAVCSSPARYAPLQRDRLLSSATCTVPVLRAKFFCITSHVRSKKKKRKIFQSPRDGPARCLCRERCFQPCFP
ncbi:hypothetical protein C8R45DRAFT_1047676 [Mycena sanguinolenta]|nr:hypothetical protein C8R45DRAFT_1047676 [Mycena sanguinolenta]